MEDHGGRLALEDREDGPGTRAVLVLPRRAGGAAASPERAGAAEPAAAGAVTAGPGSAGQRPAGEGVRLAHGA